MNSKLIVLAFLACLASSLALSKGLGEKIDCLHQARVAQGRILEGTIRDAVEKIRKCMKEGCNGYPTLDPLDVKDYHLVFNNKFINMDSNWTAVSQGLANFELPELSLSLIGLNLKFKVVFPGATGSGDYSVDLTSPLVQQKVFGKGHFDIGAHGLTVTGKGKVGTKLAHGKLVPQIKKLEVDATLNDFALALTGFMNDEELSKNLSDKLTSDLPKMLQEQKAKINEIIAKVIPYVNDYLTGDLYTYGVDPIVC